MNILTYTQPCFRYSFEALKIAIWSFSKKKIKQSKRKNFLGTQNGNTIEQTVSTIIINKNSLTPTSWHMQHYISNDSTKLNFFSRTSVFSYDSFCKFILLHLKIACDWQNYLSASQQLLPWSFSYSEKNFYFLSPSFVSLQHTHKELFYHLSIFIYLYKQIKNYYSIR